MDGYQRSFDKLWGYNNVVRFGAGHLQDDGCIVLVSGAPARRMKPGQIAIGSVGGAVEAFVRGVAPELAPRRINVVSPGLIDTPMVSLQGAEREAHYKKLTAGHLIPRAGTADEVAVFPSAVDGVQNVGAAAEAEVHGTADEAVDFLPRYVEATEGVLE